MKTKKASSEGRSKLAARDFLFLHRCLAVEAQRIETLKCHCAFASVVLLTCAIMVPLRELVGRKSARSR